jgi:hypothetical protein
MAKKPIVKTPWFPFNVKPVRKGFYEVGHDRHVHHRSVFCLTGTRRYWDGKMWCGGWMWVEPSIMGQHPTHQWRGVFK